MKIRHSPASPFVRRCIVTAIELGVDDRIERLPSAAHPVNRDRRIIAENPLGQVPTFFDDDDNLLVDSRVICEYLDSRFGPNRLFPDDGAARWRVLTELAIADGMANAMVLARYELAVRPENLRWKDWLDGQLGKVNDGIAWFDDRSRSLMANRVDIATIALGCALGYLEFRFPDHGWRTEHPALAAWFDAFSKRDSMQATTPHA